MTTAETGRIKWFSLPKTWLARTFKGRGRETEAATTRPSEKLSARLPDEFQLNPRWPTTISDDQPPARKPVILVALGPSRSSLIAAEWATEVARKMDAALVLVHAVHLNLTPYGPANPAWLKAGLCQEAMARAEPIMTRGQAAGVAVTCAVEEGAPAAVIAKAARRWHAQAIVLAPSKSGLVKRLFGRHTVEKVLHEAECPVVILESSRSGSWL